MKNKWLSFFSGKVQLEVKGTGVERLLNECTRRGIPIFHVKKRRIPYGYLSSSRMYMPFAESSGILTVKPGSQNGKAFPSCC